MYTLWYTLGVTYPACLPWVYPRWYIPRYASHGGVYPRGCIPRYASLPTPGYIHHPGIPTYLHTLGTPLPSTAVPATAA